MEPMRKLTAALLAPLKLENKPVSWALVIALTLAAIPLEVTVRGQEPGKIYNQVKQIEGTINWPSIYVERKLGVFDAATGGFAFSSPGLRTFDQKTGGDPDEKPYHKPEHIHEEGAMLVQATDVGLIFEVKNRKGDFSITVNGKTVAAPPNANSITINVGAAAKIKWSVHSGGKGFGNEFTISRSNSYGAGVFTVPALPVAILYEPPMDKQHKNYATYTETKTVGTTIKAGWSDEKSTTIPSKPSRFVNALEFKSDADKAGAVLSKIPNAYTQAIGTILQILAVGVGNASASSQNGKSVTTENALILNAGQQVSYGTAAKLGPGLGDRIIYLKNARLAWLGDGHMVNVSVLGYEKISSTTVKMLRDDWDEVVIANLNLGPKDPGKSVNKVLKPGSRTGLDAKTILSLLKLDPFYGHGSQVTLDEKRFAYVETFEPNGANDSFTFFYDTTKSYMEAATSFNVETEDYSAGFLKFLGLGVTETKKLMTKTTVSNSEEFHSSQKAEVSAHFHAGPDESYSVAVYYDRIFGTFAFKEISNTVECISGTARSRDGQPMAKQIVTLTIGGKKFSTRTDAEGRYSFRSSNITGGEGQIEVGNSRQIVHLQMGNPIRNLELRSVK